LKARSSDADERIKRLMQILKAYDRARFGRRSEKLGTGEPSGDEDAQQAFVFEEIETGISALRAQTGQGRSSDEKRPPRARKGFPPHLERVEVVIEPEDLPEHAGKQKVLIGEDVSERLDVIPAKFRVIVTRRPKYAFKGWDGVIQALAPAHIIESGLPTEALVAQIAVSKYADGLPLYRQEGIYARDLVDLDRRLMAQWMGRVRAAGRAPARPGPSSRHRPRGASSSGFSLTAALAGQQRHLLAQLPYCDETAC